MTSARSDDLERDDDKLEVEAEIAQNSWGTVRIRLINGPGGFLKRVNY